MLAVRYFNGKAEGNRLVAQRIEEASPSYLTFRDIASVLRIQALLFKTTSTDVWATLLGYADALDEAADALGEPSRP